MKKLTKEEFNQKYGQPRELKREFYPVVVNRLNKHWKVLQDKYYHKTDGDIIIWVEGYVDAYDLDIILKKAGVGYLLKT